MSDIDQAPPYDVVAEDTKDRVVHLSPREAAEVLDDGMFWDNEGPGFSCREAEALGALLWHAGVDIDRVVDLIVTGHGQPDRSEFEGDDHWHTPKED
jgi:hypothetical protein